MRTPLALVLTTSLALSHAAAASAQPVDAATRATARQLGEEGMKAFDQGDCTAAVDKLSRAHDLVHVPTLAFYAGKCLEKLGRLVDAEERYLDATRDPVEPGAPATVKAAQADAERARKALLPRIPSIVITLNPPVPDAQITLDGKPVPPAMIGVKRPIDPGQHTAQVTRYGAVASRQFSLQEYDAHALVLDVPVPGAAVPPGYAPGFPPGYGPPAGYAPGYAGAYYAAGQPPIPMKRRNMGLFVAGCIIAPAGALATLGGGVLVLTEGNAQAAGQQASTGPGYALLGVGLLGMAGGIAMAVIGGKKVPVEVTPMPPPPVSFEPLLGPGSVGMRMRF